MSVIDIQKAFFDFLKPRILIREYRNIKQYQEQFYWMCVCLRSIGKDTSPKVKCSITKH